MDDQRTGTIFNHNGYYCFLCPPKKEETEIGVIQDDFKKNEEKFNFFGHFSTFSSVVYPPIFSL